MLSTFFRSFVIMQMSSYKNRRFFSEQSELFCSFRRSMSRYPPLFPFCIVYSPVLLHFVYKCFRWDLQYLHSYIHDVCFLKRYPLLNNIYLYHHCLYILPLLVSLYKYISILYFEKITAWLQADECIIL